MHLKSENPREAAILNFVKMFFIFLAKVTAGSQVSIG